MDAAGNLDVTSFSADQYHLGTLFTMPLSKGTPSPFERAKKSLKDMDLLFILVKYGDIMVKFFWETIGPQDHDLHGRRKKEENLNEYSRPPIWRSCVLGF